MRKSWLLSIATLGYLITGWVNPVVASSVSYSESAEWRTGVMAGVEGESMAGEIKLKTAGSWEQRAWQTPDIALTVGTAIESDGSYVYVLAGGDTWFGRYNPTENKWKTLARAPFAASYGSDLVYLNGYLYAIIGGYQREYARYDVTNDTWTELTDAPDLIYRGGSLGTDGTNIYALHGNGTTDFWKYTVSTGEWSVITGTPATINYGASLVYSDGYFYTLRGASTTTMYRYSVAAGTWSTMTAMTSAIADDSNATIRGDYIYITLNGNTTTMYRYSISGNAWSTMAVTPQGARYVGSVYNASDDMVYVFRGNAGYELWKYDPDTNGYSGPVDMAVAPGSGSDLVYYNGYVYQPRGANTTTFYRYNLTSKTWESRAVAPAAFNDDTTGVVAGAYIYFFQGSNTPNFYRYDPALDSWSTMAVSLVNVRYGGSLAYPGSGDYIYATTGNYTLKYYRYSISGNSWSDTPADLPNNSEASYGARLLSDGTDMYYVSGSRTGSLLKYTVASDTWSDESMLPYAPFWGTDAVYWNGNIYVQAGYYSGSFWRYNIASETWRYLDSLQEYYGYDQGPYNGGALVVDTVNGILYSAVGASILNMASYSIDANDYVASGTWTSPIVDLTYVTAWTSLAETVSEPSDSTITYETRTSADKVTWGDWTAAPGGTIASTVNRYIQVRATLTASTGRVETPTLAAVTINYEGDVTDPTNASVFSGSSTEVGGSALVTGSSYRYNYPYFSWSGASDAGVGVAGYYVYFGTSASADPESEGSYQTASDYVVTANLTTGTYYLRVATKDSAGNVSAATTGFTYVYQGVVSTSVAHTTSADFAGTLENVEVTGDQIQLAGKAGFWREEAPGLTPATVYYGSGTAYVASSEKLYTLRGFNTTTFYSYDIATKVWSTLANTPAVVHYGGKIVEGPGGYLYAFAGNNTSAFWRYDIAQNTWDDAASADAPTTIYYDSALVYDGSQYIYALRGTTDDTFLRYDPTLDEWATMANVDFGATSDQLNNLVDYGAALAYDGANTIYALQGTQKTGFAAYNITTDTWTQLEKTPFLVYQGGQLAYDADSASLYMIPGGTKPYLYKYTVATGAWSQLDDAPWTLGLGTSMRNAGGTLYIVRGLNTRTVASYDIADARWKVPERDLFGDLFLGSYLRSVGYGSEIVKGDGNNLYITRGNESNDLIRYNYTTGVVTEMAGVPSGVNLGGSMVYDNTQNKLYATASTYNDNFYVYDIATNVWSREESDHLPIDPNTGASLAYDGARYIYYARGGGGAQFYRFDTQGVSGAKWSTLTSITATVNYGSQLVYKDGYVYTLRGSNVNPNPLYRYDVTAGTWSSLTSLGASVYNDGFLVDGGGDYLYACRGANTVGCYRYSISGDSWSAIADAPGEIYVGGSATSDGAGKMYVLSGSSATNNYPNGLYTYVMESDTTAVEETGTYQSPTIDLGEVYRLANLSLSYTSATGSALAVATRTSADNVIWDNWSSASELKTVGSTYEYKINSAVQRYLQVQLTLTSTDGFYTGIVTDYTVEYYSDTVAPTNASELTAYSTATMSASLTTNTWYNYAAPYFDWPDSEVSGGATDSETGSAVTGYYVYLGTSSNADPESDGSWISTSAFTASSLTSGNTYYLRIKSKDDAGNVSATAWEPFIYKYDGTVPPEPTGLSADPSGYSSVNNFDFSWDPAVDAESSIASYCYKTATASGALASDQCVASTTITGITGYQTGTNTFYVRSRDTAGNYSAYTTGSFYFNNGAPSAPTSLVVTPETNTVNSFEFSWSAPSAYYGSLANLKYYYSVNALPSSSSVTRAYADSLGASSYATLPGENTFYVVAMDEAGNIDYDNYTSTTFTANTTAPGIPLNTDIADVSVKSTSSWKLALSWESPSSVGAGVASYQVYRSTDDTTYTQRASTAGISYVDTGLTQTTYYYKVRACDSANNCGAFSSSVNLLPDGKYTTPAPLVGEPEVSEVTTKKADIDWTTSRTADSKIAYGTASGDYFDEEVGNSDQATAHALTLNNLEPGTTYYFVAKWSDEDGNLGTSEEYSFSTDPAPSAKEVKAVSIGLDTVNIQFTSKDASKAKVYYGTTTAFGGYTEMGVGVSESTYTVQLTGLADGTKYYYKVSLFDSEDNEYEGDTYSFETLPRPKIEVVKLQQVKGTATGTVLVTWMTNTAVSSIATYYPSSNPSASADSIDIKLTTTHRKVITDLLPNTAYTLIIKGRDKAGNEAISPAQTFTTSADTRPPSIANLKVESVIQGVGEEATSQLVVSWDTDELGSSQVAYGDGSSGPMANKTQLDSSRTYNHLVVIPNLSPAKVYHLKVLSIDEANNEAESIERVVITPKATKSALNLVVSNLSQAFGFLGTVAGGQ